MGEVLKGLNVGIRLESFRGLEMIRVEGMIMKNRCFGSVEYRAK